MSVKAPEVSVEILTESGFSTHAAGLRMHPRMAADRAVRRSSSFSVFDCATSPGLSCSLEAICKAEIRFDRRGVVGHRFEKSPWLKAGKVECDDCMLYGRPSNLEISLIAKIARMAGIGWINQDSTSKSIDPVVG